MSKSQNIPQFKCLNQNHKNSNITLLCLQNKCKINRKCCIYCVDEQHSMHHLVSIQKFLSDLDINLQKNNKNEDKIKIYQVLNTARQYFDEKFQQIKSTFHTLISECQQKTNKYFNVMHEFLGLSNHQTIKNHIFNTFADSDSAINEYLQLLQKSRNAQFGTYKETKKMLEYNEMHFQSKFFNKIQQISISIKDLNLSLDSLKITGKKVNQDYKFSVKDKASSLDVSDSKTNIIKNSMNTNYSMCCLNRPIDPLNSTFFVKIDKNPSKKSIWLGVCVYKIAKTNYFSNCNGFKKGAYAIDQNYGYSYNSQNQNATVWNHSVQNMNQNNGYNSNNSNIGWTFGQGDVIRVEVNFQDQMIRFSLINTNLSQEEDEEILQYFEMPVDLQVGELYPFVGLNGLGDKVTVLERQEVKQIMSHFGIGDEDSQGSNSDQQQEGLQQPVNNMNMIADNLSDDFQFQ